MSAGGHTPGPWEVVWSSNTDRPMEILGPERRKIVRWGGLGEPAKTETSLNAKLIAAAPALADALYAVALAAVVPVELAAQVETALRAAGRLP